ncbi:hypothetical protein CWB55_05215 [Staphylococcus hominis]|nr:hypothetical protein CWC34_05815 [Staphylococcus hominis]PJM56491.1 hypothetical protein CWB55_05215 [Staphylococcus hominis]
MTDEKSAIKHFRAASRVYKEERDAYKKQRDELINDMQNVKRKAEAFDLILEFVDGNTINVGDSVKRIVNEYYKGSGSDG